MHVRQIIFSTHWQGRRSRWRPPRHIAHSWLPDIFWAYSSPMCAVRSQKKNMKNSLQPCRNCRIGRGIDYAVSLEGSLKLKEISYIHSEAYAAGELKHGTISLIEDGILVVSILTQEALYEKMISNMVEVKCRGAYLMGLTTAGNYNIEDTVDFAVYIPKTDEHFTPSLAVVPLQLLGYYVSVSKGLDVDKPRNLAKSVTVE